MATTFTPGPTVHKIPIPAVFDISTSESNIANVDSALFGFEELKEKESIMMEKSKSFINPLENTAELENFQNLILLYASKRHSYKPPAFRARNLLAALDHNSYIDRDVIVNTDGKMRYQRSFNEKGGRWSVNPKKADKQYLYIPEIISCFGHE